MSDTIFDLNKAYEENVLEKEHPRSIGLFTIPEYPELEARRGMWSAALEAILTTLRYLAPATLLTLFWGQESFLFRLLKSIDNAFRAIIFSSEEQKEDVLQWLAEAGPVRVEHLDTVWRHGWILCGVLDAALPGACAGHPPTRLSLKHAQTIADHYLGVEPVFSRQELESNDSLSKHQEWKLATFLDRVRQALAKVSPPVSKPPSHRTSPETSQFTLDYVARGSGLVAAQVRNKVYFKIYPTAQQCLDPGEITILIKGPRDTYGMTVIPPIFGKAQLIRQKLLGLQTKPAFTENALPITQGATYLRSYGKNDMNKTYFIPKDRYDIEINVDSKPEHSKIGYTVSYEGRHELSITSRGQHIVGSPFTVTASHNIIDILQQKSFCLEDGEEIDIVDIKSDRKVVLRIVDFVTEKMLLKENGTLEKISDDEAKILMTTDENQNSDETLSMGSQSDRSLLTSFDEPLMPQRFNTTAQKILKMNRVCKMFNSIMAEKQEMLESSSDSFFNKGNPQDVPDIVNSTLSETNTNKYVVNDKRDTFIIPESISVSLRTEKPKSLHEQVIFKESSQGYEPKEIPILVNDCKGEEIIIGRKMHEDNISFVSSSSNPFLNETYEQGYETEKILGSFINTEYETNRSQSEVTTTAPINIFVEETYSNTPSPLITNPFIEPDIVERPKTPVLKILTGDIADHKDSIYVNSGPMSSDLLQGNEFINPFFIHRHSIDEENDIPSNVTDFIIGAPVSLPPSLRVPTPEPALESLMIANNENITQIVPKGQEVQECASEVFSTPTHTNKSGRRSTDSLTFHSLDSDATENVEIINITTGEYNKDPNTEQSNITKSLTPRRDMWDSAYVSIDDSNSSPDTNNNESSMLCEIPKYRKNHTDLSGLKSEELIKMGPAERELWLTCSDLNVDDSCRIDEFRPTKSEIKRMTFTPIIEENDRSISSAMKELPRTDSITKQGGLETVTVAFAELNDMYHQYFPTSDSLTVNNDNIKEINEIQYTVEKNHIYVDSASEKLSDVKRRAKQIEGEISEVQSNVTESVSASQTLQNEIIESEEEKGEIKFGSDNRNNIVLERKKYWDDRIREIEAKSDEIKANQKKRRLSSKHLRPNDSLSKKRGKEIAKKILSEGGAVTQNVTEIIRQKYPTPQASIEETQTDGKLVEKWKKYWDDKLEVEREETDSIRSRSRSPKSSDSPIQMQSSPSKKDELGMNLTSSNTQSSPTRQELPEEVFKAFETSPKRFFGTSRKQILNKIDSFFGKPSVADQSSEDVCGAKYESGLVSSRISLFHNISQKDQAVPWKYRKSRSMHNIYHRKDSEKSIASADEVLSVDIENKRYQCEYLKQNENYLNASYETLSNIKKPEETASLKDKRARMTHKIHHKTFDETFNQKHGIEIYRENYDKKAKPLDSKSLSMNNSSTVLCKTTVSKSEMDIFSKTAVKVPQHDLDKYKSCEELPKINVKNVISIFESASKSVTEQKLVRRSSVKNTGANPLQVVSQLLDTAKPICTSSNSTSTSCSPLNSSSSRISSSPSTLHSTPNSTQSHSEFKPIEPQISHKRSTWVKNHEKESANKSLESATSMESIDIEIISMSDKCNQGSYQSISDIGVEIVESKSEISPEPTPDREIVPELKDYKSRFKMAKNYFKSLEELREPKKSSKLNECELMLYSTSDESPEHERPQKRVKKNIKAHSLPSSEISKAWEEMQENQGSASNNNKLVKISEKFNVEDLFNDVMEGKLSRQGSLRGIPHKKAVLETFRSMENVSVNKLSSYEMAVSQLNQYAKENKIKNAQTYLTEYPYLPTTDPSKYHSRFDAKASGLISMKELLNTKPRRNSVPDLRLNPTFTVEL
ncbi:uncharacterized protein LOC134659421 [Cydia amplana]|uniref:uncharacterized protein LOC134659421 n=1 Tax=Cydia amplana TaxID=1869771 RepID=UPI002FE63A93